MKYIDGYEIVLVAVFGGRWGCVHLSQVSLEDCAALVFLRLASPAAPCPQRHCGSRRGATYRHHGSRAFFAMNPGFTYLIWRWERRGWKLRSVLDAVWEPKGAT